MRWDIRGQLKCFTELGKEVVPVEDSEGAKKQVLIEQGV
jgi:hypothetical protein